MILSVILISCAFVIIIPLAWYAGSLLFRLKAQKLKKFQAVTQQRENIIESIRVISMAMEQQQCNLSEGCIRLVRLLEILPGKHKPDLNTQIKGIYSLYLAVKDLPTHKARKRLSPEIRNAQDVQREEKEAQLEVEILTDLVFLKNFTYEKAAR